LVWLGALTDRTFVGMLKHGAALLMTLALSAPVAAETVTIEARRDATLIEDAEGGRANGSGPSFFVGRTSEDRGSIRRGLLYFDVASAVPRQAIVEHVALTLYANQGNNLARDLRLVRVLADWGEGPSAAAGGGGRPSEAGDVTWIHTFHDTETWVRAGGQFLGSSSASLPVAGSGFYTWASTNRLVNDVRHWSQAPTRNFGWIVIGDETAPQTAKNLASREDPDPARRPTLEITYRLP
jgi:hypothetical protein